MSKITKLDIKAGLLTLGFVISCLCFIFLVNYYPLVVGMLLAVLATVFTVISIFVIIRIAIS